MWIDDDRCFECGEPAEQKHHVVPISLGGTKTIPLCRHHHDQAHSRNLLAGYLVSLGMQKARARAERAGAAPPWAKIDSYLAKHILRLRIVDGWTQQEIADVVGLTQSTVCRFLRSVNRRGATPPINQRPLFAD